MINHHENAIILINLKIKSTKNTTAKNDRQPIELFVKILFRDMP